MTTVTVIHEPVTRAGLLEQGFSEEQIARLEALRPAGQYLEFVDDARQWARLCFLKWLYENGKVSDDLTRRGNA